MPDRYLRITEMLTEKEKLSVADFERMHADFVVVLAREWVPIFIDHLSDKKLNENEAAALEMLKEWDYTATPEATAPTVFHAMVQTLAKNISQEAARYGAVCPVYRQQLYCHECPQGDDQQGGLRLVR